MPVNERLPIYDVYLKRASDFFGIGKVRGLQVSNFCGQHSLYTPACKPSGAAWRML